MTSLRPFLFAAALVSTACASSSAQRLPAPPPPPPPAAAAASAPTLLVFLTVDQLRTDYLTERFRDQFTAGLRRFGTGGALFVNGVHDHAITETAPGHAATMSGRFPVHTGIVMNSAGVNTAEAPLIAGGRGPGASPFRFRGTTLTDWLLAKDARTRVLSVSRKDRGAILPIGRSKQQVYWYAGQLFTTSIYYRDTLPTWVQDFNARRLPQRTAGRAWTPLLDDTAYAEPDSVWAESQGQGIAFPHRMPDDSAAAAASLPGFPWMDEITLQLALAGVEALQLGRGPQTDVLAISLSTLDAVGHRFGPDARETHDMVVRLDRYLGAFVDSLYRLRDSTQIVFALTGDHGVAPLIEAPSRDPHHGAGYVSLDAARAAVVAALRDAKVDTTAFDLEDGILGFGPSLWQHAPRAVAAATDAFLRTARRTPGILRADRLRDLARADTVRDALARRWLHMFDPATSTVAAIATIKPYHYWAGVTYATHGSPHDYDARVPVLFYGPGFSTGQFTDPARVVDMAATLAQRLGVRPLEQIDGVVLPRALAP